MPRKTPVLLRRAPLSGRIDALTGYTRKDGGRILQARPDGKHDVTADFDAIVCELLLDSAPDALPILDDVTSGEDYVLGEEAKEELRRFFEAIKEIVERHNDGPHVKRDPAG
jgi:hypothetical protein